MKRAGGRTVSIGVSLVAMFLPACADQQSQPAPERVDQTETSRFSTLDLEVGMNREQVEEKVAVLLGTRNTYSTYGNNLRGGTVLYLDGDWVLRVDYEAGAPAPWIVGDDGTAEHYPPVDESVVAFEIERIPNGPDPADTR